jgi:putative two-component system response regulator
VLLVDQDPSVAEAIALCLARTDLGFLFAADYKDAIRILAEQGASLDLVITDVEPRGPALALLTAIKTFREDLPVIVLTSATDPAVKAEALRRGAAKLLNKPIDFAELRTMVACLHERKVEHATVSGRDDVSPPAAVVSVPVP